jgi:hypothetical protein
VGDAERGPGTEGPLPGPGASGEGMAPPGLRSTPELLRSIAADAATLVRKEVELARHEIVEAVTARLVAAGALAAAAVLGLLGLVFGALAAAAALDLVLPAWAAALIVAGGLLVLALAAAAGAVRARRRPLSPEETKRTVREDLEWAKRQLRR